MSNQMAQIVQLISQIREEINRAWEMVDELKERSPTIEEIARKPQMFMDYKQVKVLAPQPPENAKLLATSADASIRMYKLKKEFTVYYGLQVISGNNFAKMCAEFAMCMEHSGKQKRNVKPNLENKE